MNKKLVVKCPHCKVSFQYDKSENRPFCSEQCKMVDLGHWLDESYNIKGRDNSVYIEDSGLGTTSGQDEQDEDY